MKIAVSYLSSDNYKKCIERINKTSCDMLHVDMCDGKYVEDKNFTMSELISTLKVSTKPLDIHMMVQNPMKYIDDLAMLNVETITIHINIGDNPLEVINYIQSIGLKAGIAINPNQDISELKPFLDKVDEVLIMSVIPGKGGQSFIETTVEKINQINVIKANHHFIVGVDGGINSETVTLLKDKNIDLIISGSYVTKKDDFEEAINLLKDSIK